MWVSTARSERERGEKKEKKKKKRVIFFQMSIFGFQCLAMNIERLIKNLYSTFGMSQSLHNFQKQLINTNVCFQQVDTEFKFHQMN